MRTEASELYPDKKEAAFSNNEKDLENLEEAFYFSMVSAYAQGMHLLSQANVEFKYELNLAVIAKIWRGGCIIRSEFLEDIYAAYQKDSSLEHLFLNDSIHKSLIKSIPGIRTVVSNAALHGISVPTFAVALSYLDNVRNKEMPANLIQAQRDFFGAHTYELKGKEGVFHTDWENPEH